MITHNPKQAIEQLQTILSSPSKKIGFLFGAGISMNYRTTLDEKNINKRDELIQGVKEMTTKIISSFIVDPQKSAIESIKKELEVENKAFNIEALLSKISEKETAAGKEMLCGLNKENLKQLRKDVEEQIKKIVSVHNIEKPKFDIQKTSHHTLSQWIRNADREYPVEIFTTNYDYLLELALEKEQIPYFDGFIGSYQAFFYPEWIEDGESLGRWTKLWKLHGSLGWQMNEQKEIVRTSINENSAMIYPSFLKYDHSRKQPYLSYMDRLSYFLRQEDSVLFICGYSFGDEHINEMLLTSLARSRSSHIFILKNGELNENDCVSNEIAKKNSKISVYAKRSAVIGCKFGEWKLDKEPDKNESYNIINHGFDEDATIEEKDSKWTGKGNFILGDFEKFTNFLSLFFSGSKYINKEGDEK